MFELFNEDGLIIGGTLAEVRAKIGELEYKDESLERHTRNEHQRALKLSVDSFLAACQEFDKAHDRLRNVVDQYDKEMSLAELAVHARDFKSYSAGWDVAYKRLVAAVERLDQFHAEELREQDENIAAMSRWSGTAA